MYKNLKFLKSTLEGSLLYRFPGTSIWQLEKLKEMCAAGAIHTNHAFIPTIGVLIGVSEKHKVFAAAHCEYRPIDTNCGWGNLPLLKKTRSCLTRKSWERNYSSSFESFSTRPTRMRCWVFTRQQKKKKRVRMLLFSQCGQELQAYCNSREEIWHSGWVSQFLDKCGSITRVDHDIVWNYKLEFGV